MEPRSRIPLVHALLVACLCVPLGAHAESSCRTVEVRFLPRGLPAAGGREPLSPQIAVWVEDREGKHIDTIYVTRVVGVLGLGNRPGRADLKSDFRWPYGRRPMALPVWAHRRGRTYPLVVMGGRCSPTCRGDAHNSQANPDDEDTVAYHGSVSSTEPYYCSPSGWRLTQQMGVDVISCASAFYSSKGYFAPGRTSVYPPRADISQVSQTVDHEDLRRFASHNDVAAVSGATPPVGRVVDPPLRWAVPSSLPDGEYVIRVEVGMEGDFNPFYGPGRSVPDKHPTWDQGYGKQFIGQPSVVYAVPIHLDGSPRTFRSREYEGYGDVMGESGVLHPPDSTISQDRGSGADRLGLVGDPEGDYRVRVDVLPCGVGGCDAPPAPALIDLDNTTDTTMTVRLRLGTAAAASSKMALQVRYRESMAITEESFNQALPAAAPRDGMPGETVETVIHGLIPRTTYHVAARAVAACGAASPIVAASNTTVNGNFTTLSGCFIATAAYGSPLAGEIDALRALRDRYLVSSPIGQLLTASYYAMSPPLAGLIARDEHLRRAARRLLAPLVRMARALGE